MKRIVVPIVVIAALCVPTAALAKTGGWYLPRENSTVKIGNRVLPNYNYARHCGVSPFGMWQILVGVVDHGRVGTAQYRVNLMPGQFSTPYRLRFTGYIDPALRAQTASLIRTVRYRLGGWPPRLQSVFGNGAIQASRPFNPLPRVCGR